MNPDKLLSIIADTTVMIAQTKPANVGTRFGDRVDVHYATVGVDKAKAEQHRTAFRAIVDKWDEPGQLAGPSSYVPIAAALGGRDAALLFFALGQVLGIWTVSTPASRGSFKAEAQRAADAGFVLCSGYPPFMPGPT